MSGALGLLVLLMVTSRFLSSVLGQGPCPISGDPDAPEVICDSLNLNRIPRNLPLNIHFLQFINNNLQNLTSGACRRYTQLETLELANNDIETISSNAFRNLNNLQTLVLSSNRIQTVSEQMFHHLTGLNILRLDGNPVQYIDPQAFRLMPNLKVVDLSGISIECDCGTLALRRWAVDSSVQLEGVTCTNYGDKALAEVQKDACSGELQPARCLECKNAGSRQECLKSGLNTTCANPQAVCGLLADVKAGQSTLSAGCLSLTQCTQKQRMNSQHCQTAESATCQLCCASPDCNYFEGYLGYSIITKHAMTVRIILTPNVVNDTTSLDDPTNPQFKILENYVDNQVRTALDGQVRGKHSVTAIKFSPRLGGEVDTFLLVTSEVGLGRSATAVRADMVTALQVTQDAGTLALSLQTLSAAGVCEAEEVSGPQGLFSWPDTAVQSSSSLPCPGRLFSSVTRQCLIRDTAESSVWEEVDYMECPLYSGATSGLQVLARAPINNNTVMQVSSSLALSSTPGDQLVDTDVDYTAQIMANIVHANDTVLSPTSLSDLLETLNNLLQANPDYLLTAQRDTAASTRLVQDVEQLGESIALPEEGQIVLVQPQVALAVVSVPPGDGIGISVVQQEETGLLMEDGVELLHDFEDEVSMGDVFVAVSIPSQAFTSAGVDRVQFTVYTSQQLFQSLVDDNPEKAWMDESQLSSGEFITQVNSLVVSASLSGGYSVFNLTQPVVINFKHVLTKSAKNPRCVWLDFDARAGRGAWSTDGCHVAPSTVPHFTQCHCDHLTNFALLMDIYGDGSDIDPVHQRALAIISDIGCGVSLAGLFLTLVTYIMFRELRRERPGQILIHLSCALVLMVVMFILATQTFITKHPALCKGISGLLHFGTLAALCWMCVEAFYMYLILIKVFNTHYSRFMLKCSVVGWVIPLLIVMVTFSVNIDNYGPQAKGQLCWLTRIPFYVAFLVPALLILLLNCIAFALVIWRLSTMNSTKLTSSKQQTSVGARLRGAIGILVLLGLTWGFAIFAFGEAHLVFTYLFAICNSLQGLFIFVFHCILKGDVRKCWLNFIRCQTINGHSQPSKGSGNSGGTKQATRPPSSPVVTSNTELGQSKFPALRGAAAGTRASRA